MSSTTTPSKTPNIDVLTHQAAVHPITIVGDAIDVTTKRGISLYLYHGYVEATADTNPGHFSVQIRPEAGDSTIDEHWITIREFYAKGTTPDDENLTTNELAGDTVLAVSSTTGFAQSDLVYIQDTGVLANSEWNEICKLATNSSLTLISGLTNAKDSSDKIFNDASRWYMYLDLNGITAFRVLWHHEGATGANGHIKVLGAYYNSDQTA